MEVRDLYNEAGELREDAERTLDQYFSGHHERFHNMLFWANITILINFVIVIFKLTGLYEGNDERFIFLKVVLFMVAALLALYLYKVWRSDTTLGPEDWDLAKLLLQYKIEVMNKQARLIGSYIVAYSLVLGAAWLFYSCTGLVKADQVMKATSSVTLMMYGFGAYSLKIYLSRRCKLVRQRNSWPADL